MSTTRYLAVDLGAESGRVMLGTLSGDSLTLDEIHRFAVRVNKVDEHLYWNLASLEEEILTGLEKSALRGEMISGISTDTWGIDYVLLDAQGRLLGPPHCYRDPRTAESPTRLFQKVPFDEVYTETGIQFMVINTLYHFEAQQYADANVLAGADHFLNMADYFNALFSGVEVAEVSMASTTQIYNPRTQAWSEKLIAVLGLSKSLFPRIVPSGTVLGPVVGRLREHAALAPAQVIATCSHDTGAAVAAVPAVEGGRWAYLSSGTWSLVGAELSTPVVTEAARQAGFTNEVGLNGTIRFLKNIAGLWVLQECRRAWETAGKSFTYDELMQLATASPPAAAHLSLKDPRFLAPDHMPEKIAAFCRETGQPVPATPGEYTRTILESLALAYADTLQQLEAVVGYRFDRLYIVGGGSRSELLNQLTAEAIGRTVIAGPIEATAIGNVLIQALALGHLQSFDHLRRVVAQSFPTRTFAPGNLLKN
jgi:rhamnulokinase